MTGKHWPDRKKPADSNEGVIEPDKIRGGLGELLSGRAVGRTSARDIAVLNSLGLAVEDHVITGKDASEIAAGRSRPVHVPHSNL